VEDRLIRFTYEGKEFEFRGQYREPLEGDTFMANTGDGQLIYQHAMWGGYG